jgi:transposase
MLLFHPSTRGRRQLAVFAFGFSLANLDAEAVIPAKKNRTIHIPYDKTAYKWRHLIENYFSKIKEFRGVNTRYDKTDASYQASWHIAATIIALQ